SSSPVSRRSCSRPLSQQYSWPAGRTRQPRSEWEREGDAVNAASVGLEPHILCTDLVRIFTAQGIEVQALQGLNLRVDRGEMVAIIGASGSGKSTLLTILSGLDTPTAGSASVAGTDLLTMTRAQRVHYQRH